MAFNLNKYKFLKFIIYKNNIKKYRLFIYDKSCKQISVQNYTGIKVISSKIFRNTLCQQT